MTPPSIFNDVLGPVMRGPSSSHCAAALRIGRLCRDLMDGNIRSVLVEYDPNGSLATTHKSQGSDMGLFSGLLGWEADDERLKVYEQGIQEAGIDIAIEIKDIQAAHPNLYQIHLKNDHEHHTLIAISTGGGMIEVQAIDGAKVKMAGDFYETLVYTKKLNGVFAYLDASIEHEGVHICEGNRSFVELKTREALPSSIMEELSAMEGIEHIKQLAPVLPILSRKDLSVPFHTAEELLAYNADKNLALWELALRYESERGGISIEEVFEKMRALVGIMRKSILSGLKGTEYKDRILGSQSPNFAASMQSKTVVESQVLNQIILYVSSMMEVKSSMGVIVAAPTAGACGALPGAILGAVEALKLSEDEAIKAMLAAGMIGVFIAGQATFAAEVGGCQAECGSGACMAAAGIVHLGGGNLHQALSAASFALQNSLGMICDPIANRVEAPCLGKNVMAASNALSCANMALADYDHLIPLDQVIQAMYKVGGQMAHELKCTNKGGLSITKAAKALEAKLNELNGEESLAEASQRFKIC